MTNTLELKKDGVLHVITYEVGEETNVLDAFIDMVESPDLAFDWFDCAVLSHQLGQHLAKELRSFIPSGTGE